MAYSATDVHELRDALRSRCRAVPIEHPRFSVTGTQCVVLLANEKRALEVASVSYLAEGLAMWCHH